MNAPLPADQVAQQSHAPTSHLFKQNVHGALANAQLQKAMGQARGNFIKKRADAAARLPEFEALRDAARDIKNHALENLDFYLERFERKVIESGGQVHWCADADAARAAILDICRRLGAKTVTKGKTMIGEEIAINDHLAANGIEPVETDLGEYIVQLRHEMPSHIIAPAVHVNKEQVAEVFRATHTDLDPARPLTEPADMLAEARSVLRSRFLAADVGITGANFLIAETGSTVIVTNEGNGDLTQTLPKAHIVLASLEKVVPTLEDAATIIRLLARSATGQEMSVYTTFSTGPRRSADGDGPGEFHVVLLDNGRSRMLGTEFQDMLRCIRCSACINHCPVYAAVGGHAYGSVYPGPIGAILVPQLIGIENAASLPFASSLCGACYEVCPVKIDIPTVLLHLRAKAVEAKAPTIERLLMRSVAWVFRGPRRLAAAQRLGRLGQRPFVRGSSIRRLPGPLGDWTRTRDLKPIAAESFRAWWRRDHGA